MIHADHSRPQRNRSQLVTAGLFVLLVLVTVIAWLVASSGAEQSVARASGPATEAAASTPASESAPAYACSQILYEGSAEQPTSFSLLCNDRQTTVEILPWHHNVDGDATGVYVTQVLLIREEARIWYLVDNEAGDPMKCLAIRTIQGANSESAEETRHLGCSRYEPHLAAPSVDDNTIEAQLASS